MYLRPQSSQLRHSSRITRAHNSSQSWISVVSIILHARRDSKLSTISLVSGTMHESESRRMLVKRHQSLLLPISSRERIGTSEKHTICLGSSSADTLTCVGYLQIMVSKVIRWDETSRWQDLVYFMYSKLIFTEEVRWDDEKKRVVHEPLELAQAFRNFDGMLHCQWS